MVIGSGGAPGVRSSEAGRQACGWREAGGVAHATSQVAAVRRRPTPAPLLTRQFSFNNFLLCLSPMTRGAVAGYGAAAGGRLRLPPPGHVLPPAGRAAEGVRMCVSK